MWGSEKIHSQIYVDAKISPQWHKILPFYMYMYFLPLKVPIKNLQRAN